MTDHDLIDLKTAVKALNAQPEAVCTALGFGAPTSRSPKAVRFGRRGSLLVNIAGELCGRFHDFEAGEHGDMLDLVRRETGETVRGALTWAGSVLGGGFANSATGHRPSSANTAPVRLARTGWERAKRLWAASEPLSGTLGEAYLRQRGLQVPPFDDGPTLRFHPAAPTLLLTDRRVTAPAMLALMRDPFTGEACGVHRTFLTPEADKHPQLGKRMLGPAGSIMIHPDEDVCAGLCLTEGIETAIAVWQRFEIAPVWAAGSAGALRRFPVLAGIESLTVFADHDASGAGETAALELGKRWYAAQREVRLVRPDAIGDWADFSSSGDADAAA